MKAEELKFSEIDAQTFSKKSGLDISKAKNQPCLFIEVDYGDGEKCDDILKSQRRKVFSEEKKKHESLFAFHGSNLENIWSILLDGFKDKFGGRNGNAFGDGVYLSTEVSVSLNFQGFGNGWLHSSFGDRIAVLLACEFVKHPNSVKMKSESSGARGNVPNKYIVVENASLVRPKFLLLFREPTAVQQSRQQSKWVIVILIYVCILIGVILWNSRVSRRIITIQRPEDL